MDCTIQLMENVIVKWLAHLTSLNPWQMTRLSNGFRKLILSRRCGKSSNAYLYVGMRVYLNREWQAVCNTILYDWVSLNCADQRTQRGVFSIKIGQEITVILQKSLCG